MTLFDYEIKESKIDGLGLFTNEKIEKGRVLFKASHNLDIELTKNQFKSLTEEEQKEFIHYGYLDKRNKMYKLDFDTALRFLNFAKEGNVYQDEKYSDTYLIAKRDIEIGEEITFNYLEVMDNKFFDLEFENSKKDN